jgi:hypothetical protein
LAVIACSALLACTPTITPQDVAPSLAVSEASKTEVFRAPYDSRKPTLLFAIEPVAFRNVSGAPLAPEREPEASRTVGASFYARDLLSHRFAERQHQITSQLGSSLLGVGNFQLIDVAMAKQSGYLCADESQKPKKILVLKVMLTEYEEKITESGERIRIPLVFSSNEKHRTGTLALDVTIVDPHANGRIMHAFPVHSSFAESTAENAPSIGATFFKTSQQLQSTVDQALRVATSEVAREIYLKFLGE